VAPIDFNKTIFLLCGKIREEMAAHNQSLDTYNICINDDSIYKIYQNSLIDVNGSRYDEISDIEYKEFYNKVGELLAWSWVGISKFDRCIPEKNNPQRCIRLKKSNIQLGDADALSFLHKETRGNGYFIGEVHAVHKDLIPNARRDYFNNNDMLLELEAKLKEYFYSLYNLYHLANDQKNAIKKQQEYIQKKQEYEKKTQTGLFVNTEEQQKELKHLEELRNGAEKAKKISENIEKKAKNNNTLKNVVSFIKKDYGNNLDEVPKIIEETNKNKKNYRSDKLNKLNREQRKLISKVYNILNKILDPETAECVKQKIEEEFS
jgi:molecular chaperone HtpG